jgi:hypothetical protein
MDLVYKSCGVWVVILEKLSDTITNEQRDDVVNPSYAKFRANKLRTVKIIHKLDNSKEINLVQNTYHDKKITYIVGEIVHVEDYNWSDNVICGAGIHFFRSYKAAYFFEFFTEITKNYTGKYYDWFNNGSKWCKGYYSNGKKSGPWIIWHKNGHKFSEVNYLDGQLSGTYLKWFPNANKYIEQHYIGGKMTGLSLEWCKNGQKRWEVNYLNGELSGPYAEWYDNGNKKSNGNFFLGKKVGLWHTWNKDGVLCTDDYLEGYFN